MAHGEAVRNQKMQGGQVAGDQMDDALYAEPSLQGNAVIAPRKQDSPETQVNLELLFNAVNEGKI